MCITALVSVLSVGQVYHSFYIFLKMLRGGEYIIVPLSGWIGGGGHCC